MMGRGQPARLKPACFREDGRGYNAHEVEKAMLLDPNAPERIRLLRKPDPRGLSA